MKRKACLGASPALKTCKIISVTRERVNIVVLQNIFKKCRVYKIQ